MTHNDTDSKKSKAILALLDNPSITAAAKDCRISRETMHRWLRDPAFQTAYQTAKNDLVMQTTCYLRNAMGQAAQIIVKIMTDKETTCGVRLAAAKSIIDLGLKAVEIEELETRLSALESLQH